MIPRLIEKPIKKYLFKFHKLILLLGARQTGKTTLIKKIERDLTSDGKKCFYLNCDLDEDLRLLNTTSLTLITKLTRDVDFLLIDEAQRLDNPGLTLKIIYDNFSRTKVMATGSSAFELKNKLSDAMTGRYIDFHLFPLSVKEFAKDKMQADYQIEDILRYGSYPEVYLLKKKDDKILFLNKIIESYLYKDLLSYQKIRFPQIIKDLTKALAYQIGSEINENELANRLKVDRKTVVSYLRYLEQVYVITRLTPFSKNPRREIGKRYKIYFLDLGIRNALIGDFNAISLRSDLGYLWENFLIIERNKAHSFKQIIFESNFWRSYSGAEVDYVERLSDGPEFKAFEFKWQGEKLAKGASGFRRKYSIPISVVNRNNYFSFV